MSGPPDGVTPQGFATSLLQRLGAPVTPGNVQGIVGWTKAEGGNWGNSAHYNPLNTTQDAPGAVSINPVGVKAYGNWQQGLDATIQTLKNGRYGSILAALHGDAGPGAIAHAIGTSPWGTNPQLVAQTILGTHPGGGGGPQISASGASSGPSAARGGQSRTDLGGAALAALMRDPTSFDGKFKASTGMAGALANALSSGQYTTPGASHQQTALSTAIAGRAVNDAAAAGAPQDAQKLLHMIHLVQGAAYSQANHDAIGENAGQIKARGTDCSGLVSWLMGPQGLGIWHATQTTPTIPNAPGMQPGRGRDITVYNNSQPGNAGHVFIQIGNAFFASEGGTGIRQLPVGEAQAYLTRGSDGGTYQAFHPKGL